MMRLALGFVLAMTAFGAAALWTIRQLDPVLRLGAPPPAEVRTVEVALPPAPPSRPAAPDPEPIEPEAEPGSAVPEPASDDGEPEPPAPGPVVVAAEPSADESAALIRRMLTVYRRTAGMEASAR